MHLEMSGVIFCGPYEDFGFALCMAFFLSFFLVLCLCIVQGLTVYSITGRLGCIGSLLLKLLSNTIENCG